MLKLRKLEPTPNQYLSIRFLQPISNICMRLSSEAGFASSYRRKQASAIQFDPQIFFAREFETLEHSLCL